MVRACILTDSTTQFPNPIFQGQDHIHIVPVRVQINGRVLADGKELKTTVLEPSCLTEPPQLISPSVEDFTQMYRMLEKKYQEIVVILSSSQLSPSFERAKHAAAAAKNSAAVHLIDSQTTSVGVGLLVQTAAQAAVRGMDGGEISRLIRGLIPRVYTIFSIQSLTYLTLTGLLDPSQAVVGEMMGMTPMFYLEHGRLVAVHKLRNPRQLVDMLSEFLHEFGGLSHIALVHGTPFYEQEARLLRERLNGSLSGAQLSEHPLNLALAAAVGPRAMIVIAYENTGEAS